jgi:hypothetical protein
MHSPLRGCGKLVDGGCFLENIFAKLFLKKVLRKNNW